MPGGMQDAHSLSGNPSDWCASDDLSSAARYEPTFFPSSPVAQEVARQPSAAWCSSSRRGGTAPAPTTGYCTWRVAVVLAVSTAVHARGQRREPRRADRRLPPLPVACRRSPPSRLLHCQGVDKYENEDLIKYSLPTDVWFHVDALSSAHVYLRLPEGGCCTRRRRRCRAGRQMRRRRARGSLSQQLQDTITTCSDRTPHTHRAGKSMGDIPKDTLEDACQLVKANSIVVS